MGFNMDEVAQKQNRLIANIAEQNRKAYEMFYSPTPADVVLPQYDETGHLIDVTIPNRAKVKSQMWDDVGAAIGQFSRTFYVDAVNGDDNNPGSFNAPVKTLKRAIKLVPTGGAAKVFLLTDVVIDSTITVPKSSIMIQGKREGLPDAAVTLKAKVANGYNTLSNFHPEWTCNISFLNCTINFDIAAVDTNLPYNSYTQILSYHDRASGENSVLLFNSEINLPDNSNYSVIAANSASASASLAIYGSTIHSFGTDSKLASVSNSCLYLSAGGTKLTGAIDNISQMIVGLIKDSNGVPRNVVSNIVL